MLSLANALSAPESSGEAIAAVHLVAAFVLCIPIFILSASRSTETGESFNYLLALSPYLSAVFLSTLHHVLHPIDDIYDQFEAVLQGTKLYDKEGYTTGDSIKHSVEAAYLSFQTVLNEALSTPEQSTEVIVSKRALRKVGKSLRKRKVK